MTREELQSAIQDFWDEAFHYSKHPEISDTSKAIALECMMDEAKRRSTQPLTLEELQEMNGEPVWVETPGITEYGRYTIVDHVDAKNKTLFLRRDYTCRDYGKTWLAYRSKPKEDN